MHKPNELPDQQVGQTVDSPSDDNAAQRPHDPTRRGQTHIQGQDVGATGRTQDRQSQQSAVPDSEVYGD